MNQVKSRLQTLGLLDRTLQLADDDTLVALVAALDAEHTDALTEVAGPDHDADHLRDAISRGRLDGTMEAIALVLSDACLADCIEQLGDNADHPSTDDLNEVLPGLVERHGVACTRIMLASTVAGEAPAAAIIRDILKTDEVLALPPSEERSIIPERRDTATDDAEREELKARRREAKARKQAEAAARREQAARAKRR